jgi:hypothetical protein
MHTWRLWMTLGSSLKAIFFFVSSLPQILPQAAATPQPKLQGLRKPGSSNYFSAMNVNEPKVPG